MIFSTSAAELRAQELARLSACVPPSLGRMRSMTPGPFREAVSDMLERLGYQIIIGPTAHEMVFTKDGRKMVITCADPANLSDTGSSALGRLHVALLTHNAAQGFYVTSRKFTPEARDYAKTVPIKLVDGKELEKSMRVSFAGVHRPMTYAAMCCECGEAVQHRLDRAEAVPCQNGHDVPPTIALAAVQPKEYPPPAKPKSGPEARLIRALAAVMGGRRKAGRRLRPGR
jgi:hypothetical protein